jgi:hypothetical protein
MMDYAKNAAWSWWIGTKETDARKRLMQSIDVFQTKQAELLKEALNERLKFYGGDAISVVVEPVGYCVTAIGLGAQPRSSFVAFAELTEGPYNPLQRAVRNMADSIGLKPRPDGAEL